MSDILLKIENISLGYAGKNLVSGINLEIKSGDFWSIIGPNGQGKSTFVKAILGLTSATAGKIHFAGINRKQIGYVPQSAAVNPNLPVTAEEFVSIATRGIPFSSSRKKRIANAFEEVKLTDKKKRNYWTLSGGERQRLHIARALVESPSLLILDEPDTGLDFVSMENLLQLLKDLQNQRNMCVMMITHNLKTAERVSDHCALFSSGKVTCGKTKEVLTRKNIQQSFAGVQEKAVDLWFGSGENGDA